MIWKYARADGFRLKHADVSLLLSMCTFHVIMIYLILLIVKMTVG